MTNLRGFRGGLFRALSALVILLSCTWLALYLDSVHQRRKAERFLSDLRSFPFANASFVQVRDLAVRYGGSGAQELPPRFPPGCTVRRCTFEVRIEHPLVVLLFKRRSAELLYSALPYLGIRPWFVYSDFELNEDRLETGSTQIGQVRRGKLGPYEGILPIKYEVWTERHLEMNVGSAGYIVGPPDGIEGPPQEIWLAWVPLVPNAPMSRVFDLDLRCFSAVWHGCTGYRELAPSAWTDNQAGYKELNRVGPAS
jgi:hypothetical protein